MSPVLARVLHHLDDLDLTPDIAGHIPVPEAAHDHAVTTTAAAVIAADHVLLAVDDLVHLCQIGEDI